jgi:regulation of enolase protein 1 (concanavalin A-like superfamily)
VGSPRAFARAAIAGLALFAGSGTRAPISARLTATAQNNIQLENAKPGTTDWKLTNPGYASGAIEGYASLTSVNRGGRIEFFVNTADPTYTLEVFRIGYYQGLGGRRMTNPVKLPGTKQVIPAPDATTGLIECNWINPYILDIPASADPTDWMSGFYYVKLTGSSGVQQYISFVVRDDSRFSDIILAETVTTAQAYNVWGGKSLYGTIASRGDTANAAIKVSFDRPYYGDETFGAGNFSDQNDYKSFEWGMVNFLEGNGYDVTYATNLDVERDPNLLLSHKAFLSVGHDEYWSWNMRDNVERARDAGISLGFFSANTSYWQVRFENSSVLNQPLRVMVGYKERCAEDPITPTYLHTCRFRDPPVNRSEDRMVGIMYVTQGRMPFVVEDASHWVFTNTGLKNGDSLVNPDGSSFIGYEVDALGPNSPANLERAGHSPVKTNGANFSDLTVYRAASGATVFASGSILWTYSVPQIAQITRNVLARLVSNAFPDGQPIRPQLAAPWQAADIGDVGRPGFVGLAGTDRFTLNGAGQDAFTGKDALYYAWQPLNGDGVITARTTGVQNSWNNRAGLMIRESVAPDARYVSLVSRPSDSRMNGTSGVNEGAEFSVKSTAGARASTLAAQDLKMPNWLRLVRTGNTFSAYLSPDGSAWTLLGSTTVAMNSAVLAGTSVASAQHAVWMTASFDHVSIEAGPPRALPAGWTHGDIGAVGPAGSASYDSASGTFTVTGAGADIWNSADAFHYAYSAFSGDGSIAARVASVSAGASWIKAGVMLRETLDPSSAQGFMLVSYAKGVAFQRRVATAGLSTSTGGGLYAAPRWVKLERTGNTFTASQSADGASWTVVGTDTIPMAATVYAGLAVSSHTNTATATATFDNVAITHPSSGACSSLALSRTSFYSGGPASTWTITVTAPSSICTWTASIDQPWLLLNRTAGPTTISGTGSGTATLQTLDNRTGAFRYGTFTIGGTAYKVTQEFY